MSKNITEALKECDSFVDEVMDLIKTKLSKKKIKFTEKKAELIIPNKTLDDIKGILKTMNDYDKIKLVVQLSCVNGNVHVRQKFN